MESKSIFASKTFWANIIGIGAGLGALYGIEVPPEKQAEIVGGILGAVNVVNIMLRLITDKPAHIRKEAPK